MTITDKKNQNMQPDEAIIELYWKRDEDAIKETDKKYGKYLLVIADNIVHNRLDSEECLNDTYLAAWNAIPPTRPNVLKAFLTAIIRRLAINRYHKNRQSSEMTVSLWELRDFLAYDARVDAQFDAKELGRIVSEFVDRLPQRRRFIFMSRYYGAESIDTIASGLHMSRSTVNKELAAIRKALKRKLEKEGYYP